MKKNIVSGLIAPFRRFTGLVILNVSGLTLGLASVVFIAIWIRHELSYDRFFKNADLIFRIESLLSFSGDPFVWTITPAPVAKSIKNDFPEVEDAVMLQTGYQSVVKTDDQFFNAENLYYTTHSYFNIFSIKVISGDASRFLTGPNEVVISRQMANVLFGEKDPVGGSILLNNTDLLTVSGVIENSPSNTHLEIDYLVSHSILERGENNQDDWGRIDFITYVLLKEKTDAEQFNIKLSGYWKSKIEEIKGILIINPLTRLYLYRVIQDLSL